MTMDHHLLNDPGLPTTRLDYARFLAISNEELSVFRRLRNYEYDSAISETDGDEPICQSCPNVVEIRLNVNRITPCSVRLLAAGYLIIVENRVKAEAISVEEILVSQRVIITCSPTAITEQRVRELT